VGGRILLEHEATLTREGVFIDAGDLAVARPHAAAHLAQHA
jgi:hypothetical protein